MATEASGATGVASGAGVGKVLKVTLGILAVLSAVSGVLLLAIPGSTASFFAWGLGPPPLAAICGGFFVGGAAAFAYLSLRVGVAGRGLGLLGIVFAIPTLGYTLINKAVFDFGRWQAMLWLIVFIAASLLYLVAPFAGAWRLAAKGPGLPAWARAILLLITLGGIMAAVSLWIDPVGSGWLPFAAPPLGGRFLGVWSMTIAFVCLWAAIRPRPEGEPFVFGASALVLGAVIGTLRGFGGLEHGQRLAFLGILVVALVLSLIVHPGARRGSSAPPTFSA